MPAILFLTAYPAEDASCRYRVYQFLPYLEQAGYECTVVPFASVRLFRALRSGGQLGRKVWETLKCSVKRLARISELSLFDFIVIHREAFPFFTPLVERLVVSQPQKVVFSFDDAIYAGHEDVSQLNHPWLYRLKHGKKYDEIIRRSAHVIAGNSTLANYARQLNQNVSIVPTVVDRQKFAFRRRAQNQPITIGWMGSRSTAPYLSIVEPALRRIAMRYPGLNFRFVGHPEYKLALPGFESLPFHLETEVEDLQAMDIGLMPLPDTPWTRGKCGFKAIQYMATGAVVVASPVGMTTELILDGRNGLLAQNEEDWFGALDLLVRDATQRKLLAEAGRRTVDSAYSLQVWGPRMVELFDRLSNYSRPQTRESAA